jgi:hypothetical protein
MILAVCLPQAVSAQSIFTPTGPGNTLTFELLSTQFECEDCLDFPSSSAFLTLNVPFNGGTFVIEAPVATARYSTWNGGHESEFALGNPYLGIKTGAQEASIFGEVGIRVPLASEDKYEARSVGMFADWTQRMGAFANESLWLQGVVNYRTTSETGLGVRLRGGLSYWIPTCDGCGEPELFVIYGAKLSQVAGNVTLWGGLSGRMWIFSEWELDFEESTWHELAFGANLTSGRIQPGLSLRLPMDEELGDWIKSIIGFNLLIALD